MAPLKIREKYVDHDEQRRQTFKNFNKTEKVYSCLHNSM